VYGEEARQRRHLMKTWSDSVTVDMESFGLPREDGQYKDQW